MNTWYVSPIVNAILLAVALWAVRSMLNGIKDTVRDFKVTFTECVLELKNEDRDLWSAVNTHGHKGLDANGSKVTRG